MTILLEEYKTASENQENLTGEIYMEKYSPKYFSRIYQNGRLVRSGMYTTRQAARRSLKNLGLEKVKERND